MRVPPPAAAVLAGALVLAGCAPTAPSTPTNGSRSPSALVAPTASTTAGSPSPGSASSPPAAGAVLVDPTLLDVLPPDNDGQAIRPDQDTAMEIAGDEDLAPGGAESRIGDHDTHIGTCVGGVHTYHVYLANPDRVVAITSAGEGRVGERVVDGLTE